MSGGYVGKIAFVDLDSGAIREEPLDEKMCREYIGGYGIGARILYSRQKAHVDPLGPENMLGFITGPLTATQVPTGARYTVVAKSPLTGGWGDANSGGDFGPYLKFAGFDAVFFTGISPKPVYVLIANGQVQIKDAQHLWGKDTYETEDILTAEYGKQSRAACIGAAGEKLSLISGIVTDHGSLAARSGLGAVMGSKKLKAVVALGNLEIPVFDKAAVQAFKMERIKAWQAPMADGIPDIVKAHRYGTSFTAYNAVHSGDSPVKNWSGIGVIDLPDRSPFHHDNIMTLVEERRHGCWNCPKTCKGICKAGEREYKYAAGNRRPEYETIAAFGSNCGNSNIDSIAMASDICNRAGLDSISGGSTIAFAMELYENGILTKKDTDGIDLKWGNHQAMIAMTKKLVNREGIGDILADGVKAAAEKIGKGSEKFAVHVGGQEPGMHNPKIARGSGFPMAAARYQMDATPGRHMLNFGPYVFPRHLINAAGVCFFTAWPPSAVGKALNAVTGWNYSVEEYLKAGERITNIRHVFNLREGINESQRFVHPRIVGKPPHTTGPLAGVTADIEAQVLWCLGALDWDRVTTIPSRAKLLSLGLDDVANDLWKGADEYKTWKF